MRSPYSIPDASNSFAYTLDAVKPGIVFSSLSTTSPSLERTKKSTRASPSHSLATNASTDRRCTSSIVSSGRSGGMISRIPSSSYFEAKSYHSWSSVSIVPGSDAIGGGTRLPSTPHSTSTPSTNSSTSTFSQCVNASSTAGLSSDSACTFEMPTDEPSDAGLTKTG